MRPLRFNWMAPAFWVATIGLAAALLARGLQSALQEVRFPDHAFFTLLFLIVGSWMATGPRELAAFRCFFRLARKKAVTVFSYIRVYSRRAARSLAALFTVHPFNRPLTEP